MHRISSRHLVAKSATGLCILGALLGLPAQASFAGPAHDDPQIVLDTEPPYEGPGHSGSRILPDTEGRILETFDALGVALLGWIPVVDFPGGNTRASDIWGYVSPAGREYAIIGLENGTGFVEVTDPLYPTIVGFIPGQRSIWRDMKVYREYAYIVHDIPTDDQFAGDGLQVVDLSRIDEGTITLVRAVTDWGLLTSHNIALDTQGGFAYLSGSNLHGENISNGGIIIVDLSDPANPYFDPTTVWADHYAHDTVARTFTDGPYAGRRIAFASCASDGVAIIDVTEESGAITLSTLAYPNTSYCHHSWLSADARWLFVNDEGDERDDPDVPTTTTYLIDVGNLTNPVFVDAFTNGNTAIDHNPMGRDGFLYEANYRSGLRVYDIRDHEAIHEAAYFDTYPANDDANFNGAWGVYVELPSRRILVSDIERGLFVLELAIAGAPTDPLSSASRLRVGPNPSHSRAEVRFALPAPGEARLEIFDSSGRLVSDIDSRRYASGPHALPLDDFGVRLSPGVYFARLTGPGGTSTASFVRVR